MTIDFQKKIMFIPIVNFITVFLWIGKCFSNVLKPSDFIKTLLKIFVCMIAITIFRILLSDFYTETVFNDIVFYISVYLYFFSMSFFAVKAQEQMELK